MLAPLPQFTDGIDLRYFIEPLKGPKGVATYLDRFPDTLYNKSMNSRFMRLMYALLGPTGIGWLRQDMLYARLQLEANGMQQFDLETFYGDPFSFGRILTESFDDDVTGLLPAAVWDQIRQQDEAYRTRAVQFMQAARLGSTPDGMALAATSGTGQNCEVIENYHWLFDDHADLQLGLPRLGYGHDTGEFTVIPRPALSRSEIQTLLFDEAATPLGSQPLTLAYMGASATVEADADAVAVQTALQELPTLGAGNVLVTGGPAPAPFSILFQGLLSNQSVPTIEASFVADGYTDPVTVPVEVTSDGISPAQETVIVSPADQHHMQVALDFLRPVASYPTFWQGRSHLAKQVPVLTTASSTFTQVLRYVTGNPAVSWPSPDNTHWIVSSQEVEAPRLNDTRQQNYANFHNVAQVWSYTDAALSDPSYATDLSILKDYRSVHIGAFPGASEFIPYLSQWDEDTSTVFGVEQALPDYTEFLIVTQQTQDGIAFINNIYPADYMGLQGTPTVKYAHDHFWSSASRSSGSEIIEIDLGKAQAVNFVSFEVLGKPFTVEIDYDLYDLSPMRRFEPLYADGTPLTDYQVFLDPDTRNPWTELTFPVSDRLGKMVYTRYIRLIFTRQPSSVTTAFLYDPSTGVQSPWSIEARNIRIGRNVVPA